MAETTDNLRLVGIVAPRRHGKTTVARFIMEHYKQFEREIDIDDVDDVDALINSAAPVILTGNIPLDKQRAIKNAGGRLISISMPVDDSTVGLYDLVLDETATLHDCRTSVVNKLVQVAIAVSL